MVTSKDPDTKLRRYLGWRVPVIMTGTQAITKTAALSSVSSGGRGRIIDHMMGLCVGVGLFRRAWLTPSKRKTAAA
jgi:hypothetical protein